MVKAYCVLPGVWLLWNDLTLDKSLVDLKLVVLRCPTAAYFDIEHLREMICMEHEKYLNYYAAI